MHHQNRDKSPPGPGGRRPLSTGSLVHHRPHDADSVGRRPLSPSQNRRTAPLLEAPANRTESLVSQRATGFATPSTNMPVRCSPPMSQSFTSRPINVTFRRVNQPGGRNVDYNAAILPHINQCTRWKMISQSELAGSAGSSYCEANLSDSSGGTPSTDSFYTQKQSAAQIRKWLYIVGFLDTFAVTLITTSLSLYALFLGFTKPGLGIASSWYSILQVISSPIVVSMLSSIDVDITFNMTGHVSDCQGRKGMLTASLALTSVSYFVMAASMFVGGWPLYLLSRTITGLCKHSQLLVRTFFSDALTPADSAVAFCHYSGISDIGCILGPLTGGFLSASYDGFFLFFAAAAIIFFINSAIVFVLQPCQHNHSLDDVKRCQLTSTNSAFDDCVQDNFSCYDLWDVFLLMFLTQFAVMIYRENYVIILYEKYNLGRQRANYILAYQAGLGALASSLETHVLKSFNIAKVLLLNAILLCISLFMLAATLNLMSLLCALIPLCFSSSVLRLAALELIVSRSPPNKLGLASGYGQSVVSLARMGAGFGSGVLLDINLDAPAIFGGVCSIFTIFLCMYLFSRQMDMRGRLLPDQPPRQFTPSVMDLFFRTYFGENSCN